MIAPQLLNPDAPLLSEPELWVIFAAAALTGHNAFPGNNVLMAVDCDEATELAAVQADRMLAEFAERFPPEGGGQ